MTKSFTTSISEALDEMAGGRPDVNAEKLMKIVGRNMEYDKSEGQSIDEVKKHLKTLRNKYTPEQFVDFVNMLEPYFDQMRIISAEVLPYLNKQKKM